MKLPDLREKINSIAQYSRKLEPEAETRQQWLAAAGGYAEAFFAGFEKRPVFTGSKGKPEQWNDFIQDHPLPMAETLDFIRNEIDAHGLDPASEGHLGYIPGGGVYPSAIGDFIAAIANRYAGIYFASPGAVRLENRLLEWMAQLIGYPATAAGSLASGGSIATLTAIVTAREAHQLRCADIPKAVVYCTAQVHHAVNKALRIAGLAEAKLHEVPVDERFRMQPEALQLLLNKDRKAGLRPFLLVASVGTPDTGAVDPLKELGEIAQKEGLWYHIDGAYGGFFVLSDLVKEHFEGIELSDSLVIDPHKGLFLPYGTGAVLVKNGALLQQSHFYQANYMQDTLRATEEWSPADLSPELSKHFRGLRMWLPLRLFGLNSFKHALNEKILLARYFHQFLKESTGFEVGPEPDLSVVLFRYCPEDGQDIDAFNLQLVKKIQEGGKVFLSSTTVDGKVYLRLAVLSFRTHLETIDRCLEELHHQVDLLLTH